MDDEYAALLTGIAMGFIIGWGVGLLVAGGKGLGCSQFDQYEDCQEIWDMYPHLSESFDASWAVWLKLGFTDLEVHEFEYCINHMPGGSG